jgi:hypothetical protein
MVLDNDNSVRKEGNELTYKKKLGFQPLHIIWNHFIIDAMFRKGSAHSNHGTDFADCVTDIVNLIRLKYSRDVPIILCCDGGFSGNEAFTYFEDTLRYIISSTAVFMPALKNLLTNFHKALLMSFAKDKQPGNMPSLVTG